MRGWTACLANCFMVVSPMPLVPPTKTATMPAGRVSAIRALDARICSRVTMLPVGCLLGGKTGGGNSKTQFNLRGLDQKQVLKGCGS